MCPILIWKPHGRYENMDVNYLSTGSSTRAYNPSILEQWRNSLFSTMKEGRHKHPLGCETNILLSLLLDKTKFCRCLTGDVYGLMFILKGLKSMIEQRSA
jgi:hypothetical protein